MRYSDRVLAGMVFFVGSAQFLTVMMLGEALWPGYSVHDNAISDLGTQSTALMFNVSVFLVGAMGVAGAYLFHRTHGKKVFTILVSLSGIGAMIVGLFPETIPVPHLVGALLAFLFGGIAAIIAYPFEPEPLRYLSVILGVLGIASLALFESRNYLGLGFGGMERMIVYPVLLWEAVFGGFLMAAPMPASAPAPEQTSTAPD